MIVRLLILAGTFAVPSGALANDLAPVPIPASAVDALQSGVPYVEVWRDKTRNDRAIDVFGAIDIQASPAIVWNIMTNCARSEIIVPRMESCKVVEKGPDGLWDIRVQKTKVNFFITHTSRFRSDYDPYKSIAISRAGGDMKVQDGIWILNAVTDGITRLTYRAVSAPSFPVSKSKMIETSKENLPEILSNLRREAEADFDSLK